MTDTTATTTLDAIRRRLDNAIDNFEYADQAAISAANSIQGAARQAVASLEAGLSTIDFVSQKAVKFAEALAERDSAAASVRMLTGLLAEVEAAEAAR